MKINDIYFNADLYDILSELKAQLAINQIPLLGHIKDTPGNIMVSCPYHNNGQERRPSAGIRKSDGIFNCFACGEVHTLQEVISFCFGYTDDMIGSFGWSWLMKNFATIAVEDRKDVDIDFSRNNSFFSKSGSSRNVDTSRKVTGKITGYVTEEELDTYRYYHPYWKTRKITDDTIVELFDLGYDKNTNCITMPNRDIHGNCLFVARRSVKTKFFNYPEGVDKDVYGIYELYQLPEFPKEVYITESMIDCLYLWNCKKYAVALNGLGTHLQFLHLTQMPCRKFILATDSDTAGKRARIRIKNNLRNKIVTEVLLPSGRKDINECTEDEILNLEEVW